MFSSAGRIIDVFIPEDKRNKCNRGFAFVRFATLREAEKAVELAKGRSWGGRKVQANIAHFSSNRTVRGQQERPREAWKTNPSDMVPKGEAPEQAKRRVEEARV